MYLSKDLGLSDHLISVANTIEEFVAGVEDVIVLVVRLPTTISNLVQQIVEGV